MLLVGGGGAGGGDCGGGGGAGGFVELAKGELVVDYASGSAITFTVGAGAVVSGAKAKGTNGGDTSITVGGSTYVAKGGGGGGMWSNGGTGADSTAGSGGCGGGTSGASGRQGASTQESYAGHGFGNAGGYGPGGLTCNIGGGGGGAGAAGGNYSGTTAGAGGAGKASSITGTAVTYAGGGGGGCVNTGTAAAGGLGGGGAGRNTTGVAGAGTHGLGGGGGGGAGGAGITGTGGNGGNGCIVLLFEAGADADPTEPRASLGTVSVGGTGITLPVNVNTIGEGAASAAAYVRYGLATNVMIRSMTFAVTNGTNHLLVDQSLSAGKLYCGELVVSNDLSKASETLSLSFTTPKAGDENYSTVYSYVDASLPSVGPSVTVTNTGAAGTDAYGRDYAFGATLTGSGSGFPVTAQILYGTSADALTETSASATLNELSTFNLQLSTLNPNTTYYYTIQVTDSVGNLDRTAPATFVTPGACSYDHTFYQPTMDGRKWTFTWKDVQLGAGVNKLRVYVGTAWNTKTDLVADVVTTSNGTQTLVVDFAAVAKYAKWGYTLFYSTALYNVCDGQSWEDTTVSTVNSSAASTYYNKSLTTGDSSTYTWIGAAGGAWNVAANWSRSGTTTDYQDYPVAGSTAIFAGTDDITVTMPESGAADVNADGCWRVATLSQDNLTANLIITSTSVADAARLYASIGSREKNTARIVVDGAYLYTDNNGVHFGQSATDAYGENFTITFRNGAKGYFGQTYWDRPGVKMRVLDGSSVTINELLNGNGGVNGANAYIEIDDATVVENVNNSYINFGSNTDVLHIILSGKRASFRPYKFWSRNASRGSTQILFKVPVGGYDEPPFHVRGDATLNQTGKTPFTLTVDPGSPALKAGGALTTQLVNSRLYAPSVTDAVTLTAGTGVSWNLYTNANGFADGYTATIASTGPGLKNLYASAASANYFVVTGAVERGTSAASTTITPYIAQGDGAFAALAPSFAGVDGIFEARITGLTSGSTYRYYLVAENSGGAFTGATETVTFVPGSATISAASEKKITVGGEDVYVFTNSVTAGSITLSQGGLAEVLVVGGGGAGGNAMGGGGGAGGVGRDSGTYNSFYTSGCGGKGYACSITGTEVVYAAGGGGGTGKSDSNFTSTAAPGGASTAGSGGCHKTTTAPTDAQANTGSGGGGGAYNNATTMKGGSGGSGIVVIRFKNADAGNPDPTVSSSYMSEVTPVSATFNAVILIGNGAESATLYITNTLGGAVVATGSVTNLADGLASFAMDSLSPDTDYVITYAVVNNLGASTSGTLAFTTLPPQPAEFAAAPTESGVTRYSATVSMEGIDLGLGTASAEVTLYVADTVLNTTNAYALGSYVSGSISTNLTGLAKGRSYDVWFVAVNAGGTVISEVTRIKLLGGSDLVYGNYNYRMKITFPSFPKSGAFAGFPVAINLAADSAVYTGCAADGSDIRFALTGDDAADTYEVLPSEVAVWNLNGKSQLYVGVPSFSKATELWMYWGLKANCTAAETDADEIWTADHTPYMNHADNSGGKITIAAATTSAWVTTNGYSVSCWVKATTQNYDNNASRLFTLYTAESADRPNFAWGQNGTRLNYYNGGNRDLGAQTGINYTGATNFVSVVFTDTGYKYYVNGAKIENYDLAANYRNLSAGIKGGAYFAGGSSFSASLYARQFRFTEGVESDDRYYMDYWVQREGAAAFGAAQNLATAVPALYDLAVQAGAKTATISAEFADATAGAVSIAYTLAYKDGAAIRTDVALDSRTDRGTLVYTLGSLEKGTAYTLTLYAGAASASVDFTTADLADAQNLYGEEESLPGLWQTYSTTSGVSLPMMLAMTDKVRTLATLGGNHANQVSVSNVLDGVVWSGKGPHTYCYQGYVYLEANKTYQFFGGYADGGVVCYLDDTLVANSPNTGAGSLTTTYTGWHPFTVRLWSPNANAYARAFGNKYALGFNAEGWTDTGAAAGDMYNTFTDPGDGSVVRTAPYYRDIEVTTLSATGATLAFGATEVEGAGNLCVAINGDGEITLGTVAAGDAAKTVAFTLPNGAETIRFKLVNGSYAAYSAEYAVEDLAKPVLSAEAVQAGSAIALDGSLVSLGTDAASATIKVYYGSSAGALTKYAEFPVSAAGALNVAFGAFTCASNVFYRVDIVNNQGVTVTGEVKSFAVTGATEWNQNYLVTRDGRAITWRSNITKLGIGTTTYRIYYSYSNNNEDQLADYVERVVTEPGPVSVSLTVPKWGQQIYYQARVANGSFSSKYYSQANKQVNNFAVTDDSTYTWIGQGIPAAPQWNDSNNWARVAGSNTKTDFVGFPYTTGATAIFTNTTDVTVYLPEYTAAQQAVLVDTKYSISSLNTDGMAANGTATACLTLVGETNDAAHGLQMSANTGDATFGAELVFDHVYVTGPGDRLYLRRSGAKVSFVNDATYYGGNYCHISKNVSFVIDDSRVRFGGSEFNLNDQSDVTGNPVFIFRGDHPKMYYEGSSWKLYTYGASQFVFEIPAGGYATVPLYFTANATQPNASYVSTTYADAVQFLVSTNSPALTNYNCTTEIVRMWTSTNAIDNGVLTWSDQPTGATVSEMIHDASGDNIHYGLKCAISGTLGAYVEPADDSNDIVAAMATGHTTRKIDGYDVVYTFTDPGAVGTLTVTDGGHAEVLVVGGGGAGGSCAGGGGGAGGVLHKSFLIEAGTYSISVGAGGTPVASRDRNAGNGGDSVFGDFLALGGGGGNGWNQGSHTDSSNGNSIDGGSGGGGGGYVGTGVDVMRYGWLTVDGQGHVGGFRHGDAGAGGGGAGGEGGMVSVRSLTAGAGGTGFSCDISGTERVYGAGGGGGAHTGYAAGEAGGDTAGAGGAACVVGKAALAGFGGGGGGAGASNNNDNKYGGAGGSGCVIVRLQISDLNATAPVPVIDQVVSTSDTSASIEWTLASMSGATQANAFFAYGHSPDNLAFTNAIGQIAATGTYTNILSGLTANSTYFVKVLAQSTDTGASVDTLVFSTGANTVSGLDGSFVGGTPGLKQANKTGVADYSNTDWAAAITNGVSGVYTVAGPMAALRGTYSTPQTWTSTDGGTTFAWGNNTVFGYTGYIKLVAGESYYFAAGIDDACRLWIDSDNDGTYDFTHVMSGNGWYKNSTALNVASTGLYPFYMTVGNGIGGYGPYNATTRMLRYTTMAGLGENDVGWTELVNTAETTHFMTDKGARGITITNYSYASGASLSVSIAGALGLAPSGAEKLFAVYGDTIPSGGVNNFEGWTCVDTSSTGLGEKTADAQAFSVTLAISGTAYPKYIALVSSNEVAATVSKVLVVNAAEGVTPALVNIGQISIDGDAFTVAVNITSLGTAASGTAKIYYGTSPSLLTECTEAVNISAELTVLSLQLTALSPSTTYYYTIVVTDANGKSMSTEVKSFTTLGAAALAAANPSVSNGVKPDFSGNLATLGAGSNLVYVCTNSVNSLTGMIPVGAPLSLTATGAFTIGNAMNGITLDWGKTIYYALMVSNHCESADQSWVSYQNNASYTCTASDSSTYTWAAAGSGVPTAPLWNDPANWSGSDADSAHAGYPVIGSTAKFTNGTEAVISSACSISFAALDMENGASMSVTGSGEGLAFKFTSAFKQNIAAEGIRLAFENLAVTFNNVWCLEGRNNALTVKDGSFYSSQWCGYSGTNTVITIDNSMFETAGPLGPGRYLGGTTLNPGEKLVLKGDAPRLVVPRFGRAEAYPGLNTSDRTTWVHTTVELQPTKAWGAATEPLISRNGSMATSFPHDSENGRTCVDFVVSRKSPLRRDGHRATFPLVEWSVGAISIDNNAITTAPDEVVTEEWKDTTLLTLAVKFVVRSAIFFR